ncbi:ankyrin repeat and KH domain-containing protein 1-like [Mercenaria mercenaria]|uniref:ankyrin repeat and KH domain-containing protein 1-like n=1 Tax=Mercenaria mercenaria TaxID=6596 RepID=UPI00234E85BD|nr:ankyrin repeat and KH domain-containing protein 1-like [Mercenaria mercenaria]
MRRNIPRSDLLPALQPDEQAGTSENLAADDGWNVFRYIKEKWNQMGSWRFPGLYDDIKAGTGRNFNNNEPRSDVNNVNFRYSDGSTPLTRALKSNDQTTLEYLLEVPGIDLEFPEKMAHGLGCVYSEPCKPPLIVAVKTGHIQLVKLLLDAGANVNSTDGEKYSVLYHSVDSGYTEITQLLLQYSPILECSHDCYDPIHMACQHGNLEIVKMLVTAGCCIDPDKVESCVSPLQNAIGNCSEEICLYLLEHGADTHNKGNCDTEPFLRMCQMGLSKVVDFCVHTGCDINMVSKDGMTALMLATKLHNYVFQRSLLFGTKNSQSDIEKLEPSVCELYQRRVDVVKCLCRAGSKLETTCAINKEPMTALSMAVKAYNLPTAVVLLKHGAKWDENCHKALVEASKYLGQHDTISSPNLFILKFYIPKILRLLQHRHCTKFQRETDTVFTVPDLRDACRQVIRQRLKQYTESNLVDSFSILPHIPSLNVPVLLKDYLCYKEIHEDDYANLNT